MRPVEPRIVTFEPFMASNELESLLNVNFRYRQWEAYLETWRNPQ